MRKAGLNIIRETFPDMKTAYILQWISEQGENIITFLVDTHVVMEIELDRYNDNIAPVVKTYSLESLTKGFSKTNQIKIAVALDLAKNDLKS